MVFLKISSYRSTLKNPYVMTLRPPSPTTLNAIFIEIIPRGEQFAMIIPRTHGISDVVARAGESVAPTIPLHYEAKIGILGLPALKLFHNKLFSPDDDASSAVFSGSVPTRRVRDIAANHGRPSLSQDPPDTSPTYNRVGGVRWRLHRPARHHQKHPRIVVVAAT